MLNMLNTYDRQLGMQYMYPSINTVVSSHNGCSSMCNHKMALVGELI